jgi:mediator of RNA polymerase II transcription subunit 10
MSPTPPTDDIKNVIQDLFHLLVQTTNYDAFSHRSTRDALAQGFQTLDSSLARVHAATTPSSAHFSPRAANRPIPEPLIHYVENGRNPDIYTREFVELVRRMNQLARGKAHAFGQFRDILAREMAAALPEVREDVKKVLEVTGGRRLEDIILGEENAAASAASGTEAAAAATGLGGQGQSS